MSVVYKAVSWTKQKVALLYDIFITGGSDVCHCKYVLLAIHFIKDLLCCFALQMQECDYAIKF